MFERTCYFTKHLGYRKGFPKKSEALKEELRFLLSDFSKSLAMSSCAIAPFALPEYAEARLSDFKSRLREIEAKTHDYQKAKTEEERTHHEG